MPQHPLLFFPEPTEAERRRPPGGGGGVRKPSAAQQRQRLDTRFQQIAQSLQSIQPTVQGLEPEQVLVLETIGEHVPGLAKAAARFPGMEWLAEMDLEDVAPQAGFESDREPDKELPCRLYAVMTNQQSMDRLVGLWNEWCQDPSKRAKRNFGPFKNLFINLLNLRRWDAEDRIRETGLLEYLEEQLEDSAAEIRFEVELWCRQNPQARSRSYQELATIVSAAGGACISQTAVTDILYHGVLVKMPAAAVRQTIDGILSEIYGPLIRCENVMFFRPFAQARFPTGDITEHVEDLRERLEGKPVPTGDAVIAIFDGLPLEQHVVIRDRLLIDDPDGHGEEYSPEQQQHGTAMASLVLHGDLNGDGEPLRTPVFLRPILIPKQDFHNRVVEVTPDDELLVDLIHRAVRGLLAGDDPSAPTVRIINLSFANSWQPFDRELSPLARLLDWLAWKYKLLFLVSIGNHTDNITIEATGGQWRDLTAEELRSQVLHALRDEQITRRPYSPSEALNVLSVGAIHADESTPLPQDRRVDLLPDARLPSTIGTVAHGFRRCVKPEIFFPGGRQLYLEPLGNSADSASFSVTEAFSPPGQRVAAPGTATLELARTVHTRGTSNATALATRCAGQIYERLQELRHEPGGERLDDAELAVLVKCLLVHGASWGTAAETLDDVFRDTVNNSNDAHRAWREMGRLKTRFLGYGEVALERAMFCTDERVSALGWSSIKPDQGHVYHLPLPPALAATKVRRRLTVTAAWLTPGNPRDRRYRQAYLWCFFPEDQLGVSRAEVDSDTARRGTVEHRILEGQRIIAPEEGDTLDITVSCKEDAGGLDWAMPYAIAVTLEVAEPLEVSIFEQVRERIRQPVEIRAGR
ncbi:MAG: S8 family peptidase [Pirellulaceae bacterium]